MGSNTLSQKSDGNIASSSDVNQYRTALNGDLVPRNASGVATNESGSIGTSAIKWLSGYIKTLFVGDPNNGNKVDEDGSDLRLSSDSGVQIDINGSPIGSGINSSGISRNMLASSSVSVDTNTGTYSNGSLTYTTIVDVSFTTRGGPVIVSLEPGDSSNGVSYIMNDQADNNQAGYIRLYRDSTSLTHSEISWTATFQNDHKYPFHFLHIDTTASAGTYNYAWKAAVSDTDAVIYAKNYSIKVFEL